MPSQPQQQASPDIPKRLPLVITPENRGSSTSYDSKLINAYVEKSKDGSDYWIYQRPGILVDSQPSGGAATGRGVWNWLGNIYSIFADTVYKDGVALAGAVDTTAGVYRFASSMGATPKLQLGNGVKAYNYDSGAGLVLINDADFPTSFVKGWAFLDGTTYVMTRTAHIQGDDINAPTLWDPLNDILAQIEPDAGKALGKQLVYVVAFKEWTTEVFYDAGNSAGSPLAPVQGAKVNWGCVSSDSVQDVDGVLFWLGTNRSGTTKVIKLESLKAEPVSTKPIERLLEGADFTTVFSLSLKLDGHSFYIITIKNENLTLAYDLEEKMWAQWTDVNGNYLPIVSSTFGTSMQHILQHESDGRLYLASNAYGTDNGSVITVDIITPNFDGGTRRRKHMSLLEFVGDQQVGSELLVRVNDYDFDPTKWSNFRRVDMSKKRPYLDNCGTFVRRVYHMRHQKPIRMPRIQALEMQIALGTL